MFNILEQFGYSSVCLLDSELEAFLKVFYGIINNAKLKSQSKFTVFPLYLQYTSVKYIFSLNSVLQFCNFFLNFLSVYNEICIQLFKTSLDFLFQQCLKSNLSQLVQVYLNIVAHGEIQATGYA